MFKMIEISSETKDYKKEHEKLENSYCPKMKNRITEIKCSRDELTAN